MQKNLIGITKVRFAQLPTEVGKQNLKQERYPKNKTHSPAASLELLLTLENNFFSIDGERGSRPYVCKVKENGLAVQWSGVDRSKHGEACQDNRDYLCARH